MEQKNQLSKFYTLNSIFINNANGKRFYIRDIYTDGNTERVKLGVPTKGANENFVHFDLTKFDADCEKGVYKCILKAKKPTF
jgi:hypothetical protein